MRKRVWIMQDIINLFKVEQVVVWQFLVSIGLAILLGLTIAYVYKWTHKGLNYESSFISTLALLAPIVTLVMFFIQGDLVLSLGLVGSLSIIRFRTPIKDTKDMVFLFWTIATGLGIGTLNWTLTIVAVIILSILMVLFSKIRYGRKKHHAYILMISGHQTFDKEIIDSWKEKNIMHIQLRSHEMMHNRYEIVYELSFNQKYYEDIQALVNTLYDLENIDKISLLSPQLDLPM
jgi:hypothetical protein